MADQTSLWVWSLVVLGPAVVLVSLLAALLQRAGHIRLRHWAEEANGSILALYEKAPRFESLKLLLSYASRILPLGLLAIGALVVTNRWWIPITATVGLVLLAEWIASRIVARYAEESLRALTFLFRFLDRLLFPLTWSMAHWIARSVPDTEIGEDEVSIGEIAAYIDVGRKEGILEPEEEDLVRSIVDFGDTQVRQVMVPRVEIISVSVDSTIDALAETFFSSKHARVPVFEGTVDHIVGVLHIRELFESYYRQRALDIQALASQPLYIPENKPLPELLQELQRRHQQMAIVVDEYGGVAGLVTVEDLLEEIVGEISDEHETELAEALELGDGSWRLKGRLGLEELMELFRDQVDYSSVPYETVSGMLCGELGYVPRVGEVVNIEGLHFTVEDADERRVLAVIVARNGGSTADG